MRMIHAAAIVAAVGVTWIAGCKSISNDKEEAESFFVVPSDLQLDSGEPTTRPAMAVAEPVIIPQDEKGERSTLIYTCKQSQATVIAEAIEGLISPEGTVSATQTLNKLVVHDRSENVRSVLEVIKSLDQPTDQLLVEARVLEITLDKSLEYDIRAALRVPDGDSLLQDSDLLSLASPTSTIGGSQGGNLTLRTFGAGSVSLDTFIRVLATKGKGRILSSPNVLVSPGTEASIISGEEVPVQSVTGVGGGGSTTTTQFKRVGVKLRVNLLQLSGDTARLELNPEVSNVTRNAITGRDEQGKEIQNPVISIRNVSSTLSLRDGEVLTIGGLYSSDEKVNNRGIPGLEDAPLISSRGDTDQRTQVIFFLKIKIIPHDQASKLRLHQPDSSFKPLDEVRNTEITSPDAPNTDAKPEAPAEVKP
jgi:type II secretory pathway component GspD/PulD (secretin)